MNSFPSGGIPIEYGLIVAAILFVLGTIGVLIRRDLIFVLLSLEVMLNAAGLAFITAASRWSQPDGQIMFILILAVAAAEVSVGLALILRIYSRHGTLDVDSINNSISKSQMIPRRRGKGDEAYYAYVRRK